MQTLSVAHYGHPLLKGAKHWSFLLFQPGEVFGSAIAYQISGSAQTYEFMEPEEVNIIKSQTYMGKVDVGKVGTDKQEAFVKALEEVPITIGRVDWNCQNWIVEALQELKKRGFEVEALTLEQLSEKLRSAKKE